MKVDISKIKMYSLKSSPVCYWFFMFVKINILAIDSELTSLNIFVVYADCCIPIILAGQLQPATMHVLGFPMVRLMCMSYHVVLTIKILR